MIITIHFFSYSNAAKLSCICLGPSPDFYLITNVNSYNGNSTNLETICIYFFELVNNDNFIHSW